MLTYDRRQPADVPPQVPDRFELVEYCAGYLRKDNPTLVTLALCQHSDVAHDVAAHLCVRYQTTVHLFDGLRLIATYAPNEDWDPTDVSRSPRYHFTAHRPRTELSPFATVTPESGDDATGALRAPRPRSTW